MLIAEIGSNHFGDMEKAKRLIRTAHDCGADLVKAQAFRAEDVIPFGSMPKEFYRMVALTPEQCLELLCYARGLGNDLFFSIFSTGYDAVARAQRWSKMSGGQVRAKGLGSIPDLPESIASVPWDLRIPDDQPAPRYAEILHVTDYLPEDPDLDRIGVLASWLGRPAGYSCHVPGIEAAGVALLQYDAHIVEKHFCLEKNVSYGGVVFRDTVHAADPDELELLAGMMKG